MLIRWDVAVNLNPFRGIDFSSSLFNALMFALHSGYI